MSNVQAVILACEDAYYEEALTVEEWHNLVQSVEKLLAKKGHFRVPVPMPRQTWRGNLWIEVESLPKENPS